MVSVIITTYKRPIDVLSKAINSIINQSYSTWELIVINDFPEDKALVEDIRKLISEYHDKRIKYIVHNKNKGACEARNTGISNSIGKFIAFLDDDDEWVENKLELLLPYLENDEVGMVYSDFILKNENHDKIHKSRPFKNYKNDSFKALLINNYIGSTSFPIMKKSAVLDVGGFNPSMKACQDLDLWIRIAKKYKILYCPQALTKYYFSEECITKNINARVESHEKIINRYIDVYSNDDDLLSLKYLSMASDFLISGHKEYFKFYLDKANKVKKFNLNNYKMIIKASILFIRNNISSIIKSWRV